MEGWKDFGLVFSDEAMVFVQKREAALLSTYKRMEDTALYNQGKVFSAFSQLGIGAGNLFGSTGYGYDDRGRELLEQLFALSLGAEDALVRPHIASGTHAIYMTLRGLLRPGDTLYYITGRPYDTLYKAIGIVPEDGSLMDYGIDYKEEALVDGLHLNWERICHALEEDKSIKVVAVQRSRGYGDRAPIMIGEMAEIFGKVRAIRPDVKIFVDNCYGEFCEKKEPTGVGAHVMAGSLIKNPGGGIAPTGGYIVGEKESIQRIEGALTVPGVGREIGSYENSYRPYYQGLFLAPSVVLNALKTATLFGSCFSELGYEVSPLPFDVRGDIIQAITFGNREDLLLFCQMIQRHSPIDAMAVPIPWEMPGYVDEVVMAAGTFVGGASIELSADGPMREPYTAYLQGGLTYEHGKLCCIAAVDAMMKKG
ncbi:methionine gamma-lyase family protein [Eubacteriales bacterium OttesenSCG-928-M02]|nr:methionine gamma-lyase family protein [Eubacteriales bacterium OttesenSCG-928-M02]